IGLVSLDEADLELNVALEEAKELGYTPFRWQNLVGGVASTIAAEGIDFPVGRKAAKERGVIIDALITRFSFRVDESEGVKIFFSDAEGEEESEVVQRELLNDRDVTDAVHAISGDPATANLVFGKIIQHVGKFVRSQKGLAFGEARVGQIDSGGDPHFLVASSEDVPSKVSTKHDDTIRPGSPQSVKHDIQRSVRRHVALRTRRDALQQMTEDGQITVLPSFTFDNWPTDVMMTRLRTDVGPLTNQYIEDTGILCDDRDL